MALDEPRHIFLPEYRAAPSIKVCYYVLIRAAPTKKGVVVMRYEGSHHRT